MDSLVFVFGSFLNFTGLVALFTYFKTRKSSLESKEGYFLGGRSLTAGIIAGSLMLTNLGATNFAGMSAQSYTHNMAVMGWEVFSGITLVLVALFLLPRYLKAGLTTIPDFLEDRFDSSVKKIVTILFLFSYVVNSLPPTLYAGSLIMSEIFDVTTVFGVSHQASVWITVWTIGIIGSVYAIFGGLKAIAYSDTFNGIGLLIGGFMVPYFGFKYLGNGDFFQGVNDLVIAHPEKFDSIGSVSDPLPFTTIFTGLLLVNLYYWGTDQGIIQRALGAKNLQEGQKGVMAAGLLKVFTPLILIIPGIIAFEVFGNNTGEADQMYSKLVKEVLPKPLIGFFAAVMFGAILSSFNSILNSTVTLFSLNIYKPYFGKYKSDKEIVSFGKKIGIFLALISMCIAPLIMNAPQGLFQYLQTVNGLFSVPIFTIIFMGYISKYIPPIGAKVALAFFVLSYGALQLIIKPDLHFLHQLAILFVISCIIMIIIGRISPRKTPYILKASNVVDIQPWKYRYEAGVIIVCIMIHFFILFSKLGLAGGTWSSFMMSSLVLWVVAAFCLVFISKKRQVLSKI